MDALSSSVIVCWLPVPSVHSLRAQTSIPFKSGYTYEDTSTELNGGVECWMSTFIFAYPHPPLSCPLVITVSEISAFDSLWYRKAHIQLKHLWRIKLKQFPCFCLLVFFFCTEEWRFNDYIKEGKQVTRRQRQEWVLLRFPNSLALKVSTALKWRESGDVAWGAVQWQRCGCIYTWIKKNKKKTFQIKSAFSGVLTSARMRFFFKALVLKLRVQFKCMKHPERPFYVVSQG